MNLLQPPAQLGNHHLTRHHNHNLSLPLKMAESSQIALLEPTTDSLTQLQDCFDQLLSRMFASIRYIDTHHPYGAIQGQSDQSPATTAITQPTQPQIQSQIHQAQEKNSNPGPSNVSSDPPAPPSTEATTRETNKHKFEAILQELAQDLVMKEQQIELLVDTLPGLGNSQLSQEARIRELEVELKQVTEERKKWVVVQEDLVQRVETVIKSVRRV